MKWIRIFTRIELVLIYLVILAGSVVRMTGSGMGCPDWPKCFGHLIPPTEREQLEWHPQQDFKKGQIIIVNESLQVARRDFTSGSSYETTNWETYTKHDYALFNPAHTWTEYINRLIGALAGIPMFILVLISLFRIRQNWRWFILSLSGLLLLGFEAWLGKLVVDGNLIPGSITIHMLGALAIIVVLCLLLISTTPTRNGFTTPSNFKWGLVAAVIFTLIQIVLGTQVREQIDIANEESLQRIHWIAQLDWSFYVHRSFSILILLLNFWLWRQQKKLGNLLPQMNSVMLLILAEIVLGILLSYLALPKFAQPAHLLLGAALFGMQFFGLIKVFVESQKTERLL
ncbi:MAG TPA: heme A synthase [Cryomorphaceae bacterium]|nr:heme A synthase [Owenweeksia sp.]MBF99102.1 heme A synthase [Owenweeksia sp.]HAD97999.1 heme A synthase [Cryomorphaceae bacterium]HBF18929.1 heme A synthase [Cryomorphaceae bacterium]HCQ15037.1 heme A synthase [Cryomorphaceae bacterium]|tara:strand:- start:2622 stop:3650 length:1029 start_codon:yes stop_codon:yes gene_type:complete